jgi:pentatricopeptide repeat protein
LWNALLSAYVDRNEGTKALLLYRKLQQEGVIPDRHSLAFALHACGIISKETYDDESDEGHDSSKEGSNTDSCCSMAMKSPLHIGLLLHADACANGLMSDPLVGSALVGMYGMCGRRRSWIDAEHVFSKLAGKDPKLWNAMLAVYVEREDGEKALRLYRQMLEDDVDVESHTVVMVIRACDMLADERSSPCTCRYTGPSMRSAALMNIGQGLHADAQRNRGLGLDAFLVTSLINLYSKGGMMDEARNLFGALSRHDVVAWTAMLDAYAAQNEASKVLQLYREMQEEGVRPDQHAFVVSLQACSRLAEMEEEEARALIEEPHRKSMMKAMALEIGTALHSDLRRLGYASNAYANNALLAMYGKCGDLRQAQHVFDSLHRRDTVSCTAMLSAYVKQGEDERALSLYNQLRGDRVLLDDCVLTCILQSCSRSGSLETCNRLHFDILSGGYDRDVLVSAALIHGYGSSASMADVRRVFDSALDPDVALWSACIAGYAVEGECIASLQAFDEMERAGICPNEVTFTSILCACSHGGLVGSALEHFDSITERYSLRLDLSHYGGLVDLLGRVGDFGRLESMLNKLPLKADVNIWSCVLSACRIHANEELGKRAFAHAVELAPHQSAAYDLMMNLL